MFKARDVFSVNEHTFFVVLLSHFKMVRRERERGGHFFHVLSKSLQYVMIRWYEGDEEKEGKGWEGKGREGKEGSVVSHRARPCRGNEIGREGEISDEGKWYQLARRRRFNLFLFLLLTN